MDPSDGRSRARACPGFTMRLPLALCAALAAGLLLGARPAAGQAFILTNYNRYPVGESAGVQAGAVVARTDDAAATWYNPAGLARVRKAVVSANASVYEASTFEVEGRQLYVNTASTTNFLGYALGPEQPGDGGSWGVAAASPLNFSSASAIRSNNGVVAIDTNQDGSLETLLSGLDVSGTASGGISLLSAGVGYGWPLHPGLRVGLGLSYGLLRIDSRRTVSFQEPPSLSSHAYQYLKDFSFYGGADLFRLTAGVQADLGEHFVLGATLKTRSVQTGGSSVLRSESLEAYNLDLNGDGVVDGRFSAAGFFFDDKAHFHYVLPDELHMGLAWVAAPWEVELDVLHYAAVPSYTLFSSDQLLQIDAGDQLGFNTSTSEALSRIRNSARAVTNVALGGRYAVGERSWVNLGLYTDNSPRSTAFVMDGAMDLMGLTAGYTRVRDASSTTVGLLVTQGHNPRFAVTNFYDNAFKDRFDARFTSVALFVAGSLRI